MQPTAQAAVYCRISSDPTGQAAGVARQQAECEALAATLGLDVVEGLTDNDVSAYSGVTRPGFERLLEGAAAGDFSHVIVWHSDRLYRRMVDLVRITGELAPHARIHTVMGGEIDLTSADGILRAQLMGGIAEYESRHKSDRIKARAKQRAEQDGRMTATRCPNGWAWAVPCGPGPDCRHQAPCTVVGQRAKVGSRSGLVIDEGQAVILRGAYDAIKRGATLQAAFRQARAAGTTLTRSESLRGALLNPRNAGLVAHNGQVVAEAADGLAIVDRDTWEAVAAILNDPARKTTTGKPAGTPLGGGLLRCGNCGGQMAAGGYQHGHPVYLCVPGRDLRRQRKPLDTAVLDVVGEVLQALSDAGALAVTPGEDTVGAGLRTEIAEAEARLDALAALLADGQLDPLDYAKATGKVRANLAGLSAKLTRRAGRPNVARIAGDVAGGFAEVRQDADRVRALLAEVLVSVTLHHDGRVDLVWREWVGPAPVLLELDRFSLPRREARRLRVAELRAEGLSISAISRELGVTRRTVRDDLKVVA